MHEAIGTHARAGVVSFQGPKLTTCAIGLGWCFHRHLVHAFIPKGETGGNNFISLSTLLTLNGPKELI